MEDDVVEVNGVTYDVVEVKGVTYDVANGT